MEEQIDPESIFKTMKLLAQRAYKYEFIDHDIIMVFEKNFDAYC